MIVKNYIFIYSKSNRIRYNWYNLNIIILIKKRFIFSNILYFYKIIIFLFIIFGIKFKQFIIINKIRYII